MRIEGQRGVDTQRQWAQVLAAVGEQAAGADRDVVLRTAMALGLRVAPGTVGCSVTERADTGFHTPIQANVVALALDQAQYDAGAGPCLSAAQDGGVHETDVVLDHSRYPDFCAAAARHGVRSSLSVPLLDVPRPAAFNFYAASPTAFGSPQARAVADLLARCVGTLLRGQPARVSPEQLDAALARRRRVRQAQDLLMAREGLDRRAALTVLMQRSRTAQRSVLEIVEELLGGAGSAAVR
jgi:hypothetical protein